MKRKICLAIIGMFLWTIAGEYQVALADRNNVITMAKGVNNRTFAMAASTTTGAIEVTTEGAIKVEPSTEPTIAPTVSPTPEPTAEPTIEPTAEPTVEPTVVPTPLPTVRPTVKPTPVPKVINEWEKNLSALKKIYVIKASPITAVKVYKDKNFKCLDGKIYGNVPVRVIDKDTKIAKIMYRPYSASLERLGYISLKSLAIADINTTYRIEVDLNTKRVNILKNNKSFKQISCTVGKTSTPTIKGVYLISGRKPMFLAERCSVKTATRINNGYYFHTILYNLKGTRVIDSRLGESLSHGCIRLSIPDAMFVYKEIPNNTLVYIK